MAKKSPQFDVQIGQQSDTHEESYQWYCRRHEALFCEQCKLDHHNKSQNIVYLKDVVRNINISSYLTEVQIQLQNLLSNLEFIQEEKQQNFKKVKEERKRVEEEISLIRQKINDHLDKLLARVISELSEVEENKNKSTQELLKSLKEKERAVIEMQQNMVKI